MKLQGKEWSENTKHLTKALHKELSLSDRNWHQSKNIPERRSAQLIINALAQIINNGKQEDIEALLEEAQKWIRREIKDPGCPRH